MIVEVEVAKVRFLFLANIFVPLVQIVGLEDVIEHLICEVGTLIRLRELEVFLVTEQIIVAALIKFVTPATKQRV